MNATKPSDEIVQLLTETRISLTDLAKEQDVASQTVWRWTTRGIKGHILSSYNVGAKNFTTREAFARWVSAISGDPQPVAVGRSSNQSADRRELQAAGILEKDGACA